MSSNYLQYLTANLKTLVKAELGDEYQELTHTINIEDNTFSGCTDRYGVLTQASQEISGVIGATTISQTFQIILTASYGGTVNDDVAKTTVTTTMQDQMDDIYQEVIRRKCGSPSICLNVRDKIVGTPEYIEDDKVAAIRMDITVLYRYNTQTAITTEIQPIGATGLQGPVGETGVGAPGPQGTQGVTGIAGLQGQDGSAGPTGPAVTQYTGPQGQTGVGIQGVTGARGTDGIIGSNGVTGSQGIQGVTGAGIAGLPGSQGIQGVTGTVGLNGAAGSQGVTGASIQGITGVKGADGSTGTAGINGVTGLKGHNAVGLITGVTGVFPDSQVIVVDDPTFLQGVYNGIGTGVQVRISSGTFDYGQWNVTAIDNNIFDISPVYGQYFEPAVGAVVTITTLGPTGPDGVNGSTGPQGSTGPSGTAGNDGGTGPQGATGVAGSDGQTGVQGIQGNNGSQGETGLSLQGITGLRGVTGLSLQGITGLRGIQGPAGVTGLGTAWGGAATGLFYMGPVAVGTTAVQPSIQINIKNTIAMWEDGVNSCLAKKFIAGCTGLNAGNTVSPSLTIDGGVEFTSPVSFDCVGVVLHGPVANGADVWVAIAGQAVVNMSGATGIRGSVLTTHGGGNTGCATPFTPPDPGDDEHWGEIGHVIKNYATAGSTGLCILHFN